MGFMTLKKGQPLTEEELAYLENRRGRSYGDGGTGGPGESGGGDGGTNSSHGSTASNNNNGSGSYNSIMGNFQTTFSDQPDAFSAEANPDFGYSNQADFSGGLDGEYGGVNVGNVSNGNYGSNGYSLNTGNDFSSGFDSYDNYGGLDGIDGAYSSGFMDSPSWMDKAKSFVVENPLAVTGGLLGLAALGPMGALSLSRLGSTADDIANPETSGLDKALGVMGLAGMPGMMGLAAKGIAKASDMMGGVNPNPGVNPDHTTAGNETPNISQNRAYTAPKVEYKFDPFTQSNGLMGSNGKISYSQLHKLVNQFKKQSGGLMSSFSNRSLTGGV